MTFDNYLQNNGFQKGDYLSQQDASRMYSRYQSSLSTPAWSMVTNAKPAEQTQPSSGNGGMGAAAGIAQNYMGGGGGGSWAGVPGGAINGFMAGQYNYETDPRMKSKKDGFGENYPDYRAQVGGTILGGVMGYYGLGSLAGPATIAAHQFMEPATREAIKWGDSWGGSGGALMVDPIGTVASGKYSGEELAYGALLGPAAKWFGLT